MYNVYVWMPRRHARTRTEEWPRVRAAPATAAAGETGLGGQPAEAPAEAPGEALAQEPTSNTANCINFICNESLA